MKTYRHFSMFLLLSAFLIAATAVPVSAQYKDSTPIPTNVPAPATIDTPFGTLHLTDGFPDKESTQKLYDNLDFQRAVQAYPLQGQAAPQPRK
jgi:hypothetical protein